MFRAEDLIYVPLSMMGGAQALGNDQLVTSHQRTYFFSAQSYSVLFFFPVSRWGEVKIRRHYKGSAFTFSLDLCLFNLGSNCILKEELVNLIRVLSSTPDFARTDFAKGLVKSS